MIYYVILKTTFIPLALVYLLQPFVNCKLFLLVLFTNLNSQPCNYLSDCVAWHDNKTRGVVMLNFKLKLKLAFLLKKRNASLYYGLLATTYIF